ncbi:response regulator [Candidatus Nitrosocosmicus arcticus]|uniref:Putative signal transduction response regulator, reiver domain n=1 Tax=Candidatus Nitrosocosmicus arcticus TaxID=2035267 RepID=A0A557SXC9_9ARCH|nr:response regulator [Candidatus Nitrosocosmicus arcticus]TVP41241.1 putative signal transduction response regulator, reiver domain [Candidatus Nitrosocosmicus arcticus]
MKNMKYSMPTMKVLIIDDNESITEAVKDFFEFENIECKTVNEGRDGISEIENQKFDLILLDIAIPSFTGVDILNELKRERIENQNIIIFTASVFNSEQINEFLEIGVKEVLTKPISLDKLEYIKQKYLKK